VTAPLPRGAPLPRVGRHAVAQQLYLQGVLSTWFDIHVWFAQELILFSRADLERSIPSMVDGLKPGQRKIMFSCFKRNLKDDIKVGNFHT
jgi:DNA gyrase/topoisomerase IV, subunit A